MKYLDQNQLIFLISAPRSGSSMLQQLICANPVVHTLPEPWFMLSLVHLFKKETHNTFRNYNYNAAIINRERFFENIPNGENQFKQRVLKLALSTYSDSFLDNVKHKVFLDKTPRYYHIIGELIEWFPKAKFILLTRNPVAVFCSIMNYNYEGKVNWLEREDRRHDILTSHNEILKYRNHPNVFFLQYEDIISDAGGVMRRVFNYLDLKVNDDTNIEEYQLSESFKNTSSIDTKSVHKHQKPVDNYLNIWKKSIDSYQKKKLLLEYIDVLGQNTINGLGYSKDELVNQINSIKVKKGVIYIPYNYLTKNNGKGLGVKQKIVLESMKRFNLI